MRINGLSYLVFQLTLVSAWYGLAHLCMASLKAVHDLFPARLQLYSLPESGLLSSPVYTCCGVMLSSGLMQIAFNLLRLTCSALQAALQAAVSGAACCYTSWAATQHRPLPAAVMSTLEADVAPPT